MSESTALSILVVEDSATDYDMLLRLMRRQPEFKLSRASSMDEGLKCVSSEEFDATLLDLSLPDSKGLETVETFIASASCPVVVLSGMNDEETALKSVQSGAQDYLVKAQYDAILLMKTLRYSIERYRLLEELSESKALFARERELRRLESEAGLLTTLSNSQHHPGDSLKATNPGAFESALQQYHVLLRQAVEQRTFKVDHKPTRPSHVLAETLGRYRATPRDVVQIHSVSLGQQVQGVSAKMNRLLHEESHYLLTRLLGYLCSLYRDSLLQVEPQSETTDTTSGKALETRIGGG